VRAGWKQATVLLLSDSECAVEGYMHFFSFNSGRPRGRPLVW